MEKVENYKLNQFLKAYIKMEIITKFGDTEIQETKIPPI